MPKTDIDKWPYPEIDDRWENGDHSWREVSERIYLDQLGCVPPAAWKGNAFAVGEPYTFTKDGAIHAMFVTVDERFFCRVDAIKNFNPERYTDQIRRQFADLPP